MQFDNKQPLARRNDPITSHIAADKLVSSGKHISQKMQILGWVQDNKIDTVKLSLSSREMSAVSGIPHERIHKRLADLERDGFMVKSEQRICRITGETVWTWMLRTDYSERAELKAAVSSGPAQGSLF